MQRIHLVTKRAPARRSLDDLEKLFDRAIKRLPEMVEIMRDVCAKEEVA